MPATRRDFLAASAALSATLVACGADAISPPESAVSVPRRAGPKAILILGGTKFLGPEIVRAAQAAGHGVTLFNRGRTNPGLFPDVEALRGDRDRGDLAALRGRRWDVVIDTSGYLPHHVSEAATLLRDAERYVFVSSISVYDAPPRSGVDERGSVALATRSDTQPSGPGYGRLKASCELAAAAAMPGRVLVVRPGLIVGPGDPTDRFTYWPVRIAAGGDVLAPGTPADPVQLVDVRDLAAWIVHTSATGPAGTFNAAGPSSRLGIGSLLEQTRAAVASNARFAWADAGFLEARRVSGWTDLPLWVPPNGENAGMTRVRSARAIALGLRFRPVAETASDTLAWWRGLPEDRRVLRAGLARAREAELLGGLLERRRGS
jgi:2'-hydroxyisoflavone reductase